MLSLLRIVMMLNDRCYLSSVLCAGFIAPCSVAALTPLAQLMDFLQPQKRGLCFA